MMAINYNGATRQGCFDCPDGVVHKMLTKYNSKNEFNDVLHFAAVKSFFKLDNAVLKHSESCATTRAFSCLARVDHFSTCAQCAFFAKSFFYHVSIIASRHHH